VFTRDNFSRFASIISLALAASHASGLTLGSENVQSYLGQPLRVELPVVAAAAEEFDASCFSLATPSRRDGAPPLRQGRIELSADKKRLLLRSAGNVDEPIVRVAIDIGCNTPLRREFTLLLDPAPTVVTSPPVVASPTTSEATQPAEPSTTQPARASTEAQTATRTRTSARRVASSNAERETQKASARTKAQREKRRNTAQDDRLVLKGSENPPSNVDAAALAALAVPRLRVSGDLPAWATGEPSGTVPSATPPDELTAAIAKERRARLAAAPIEEDLPARLEADLVVARKRIAELQSQLGNATPNSIGATDEKKLITPDVKNAQKPPVKEANAAKVSRDSGFDLRDWLWIPALVAVLGLVGFLYRQRSLQRKVREQWDVKAPITVVRREVSPAGAKDNYDDHSVDTHPPTLAGDTVGVGAATIAPTMEKLDSPLFHPNQTASHVDVSEISHVTDEAQVYADLGRTNEAIEVLAHHIDTHDSDRPSPAPWLMLFDLLRKANRRADYDRLAPIFRKQFNGRLPEWEAYGSELALDDGLEAFPHLVSRIERDWGTSDGRKFLDEMLYDNRGGSRLGFSLSAYRDLLLLAQVHDQLERDGKLVAAHGAESPGANDDDGTPKWELQLDPVDSPKPDDLDAFITDKPPGTKP
jgi:pilus assembly protein FimV